MNYNGQKIRIKLTVIAGERDVEYLYAHDLSEAQAIHNAVIAMDSLIGPELRLSSPKSGFYFISMTTQLLVDGGDPHNDADWLALKEVRGTTLYEMLRDYTGVDDVVVPRVPDNMTLLFILDAYGKLPMIDKIAVKVALEEKTKPERPAAIAFFEALRITAVLGHEVGESFASRWRVIP